MTPWEAKYNEELAEMLADPIRRPLYDQVLLLQTSGAFKNASIQSMIACLMWPDLLLPTRLTATYSETTYHYEVK